MIFQPCYKHHRNIYLATLEKSKTGSYYWRKERRESSETVRNM